MKTKTLALAVAGALATFAEAALACHINPSELIFRPLMRGPIATRASSAANQWAGRTTLASGSTSQVVSTYNVNSDSLIFAAVEAALPAAYTTYGQITSVISADYTKTVSTTAVYSGQVILATLQTETTITSLGLGHGLRVNSIVDGVSFAISTVDSGAFGVADATINWSIPRAAPAGLKVNTINPTNYFVLGWADGAARPVDATVMWEVRRCS